MENTIYDSTEIKGLKEIKAGFRGADKAMRRELRSKFKVIGSLIADEAQSIAAKKGLKRTGKLIKNIRPMATTFKVVVKAGAKNKGFNYPKRFEYGVDRSGGGIDGTKAGSKYRVSVGPQLQRSGIDVGKRRQYHTSKRDFMAPALVAKEAQVMTLMQIVIRTMGDEFSKGGQ